METKQTHRVSAGTRIGHVHLKVSDIERSLRFYRDILGFEVKETGGAMRGGWSALALPGIQPDVVVVATGREKDSVLPVPLASTSNPRMSR